MHFDLKSASFPDADFRAVVKAQVPEPPTERQDVLSKRAAEVGGMAPGVKATKVAVHLSFSVADSGWVADDQRSVHCDHSAAMSGLGLDPTQNLVRIFQASHASQVQTVASDSDLRQAARFSIPAQIDSQKDDIADRAHVRGISSTGSPTATRPEVMT
jgi:hypothetical protein